jgi:diketogulonate reductase-like aldo/keto reductase
MKLSIGTANFLKKYGILNTHVSSHEVLKILKFIKKKKLNYLDTAIQYDNFFKLRNNIDFNKFYISTKINFKKNDFKKDDLEFKYLKILKKKIKINKIKKFETIFIHNFDEIEKKNHKKLFLFMNLLKDLKITKKIGVSIYHPKFLKSIKKNYNIDIVQVPISIVDRRFLSSDIKSIIKKKKLLLQARSIFLQGTLLNSKKIMKHFNLKKKNIFYDYHRWCYDQKIDKRKSCIDFIKDQKIIDSMVVGIESLGQFKQIYSDFISKSKKNYPKNIFSNNKSLIDARRWKK